MKLDLKNLSTEEIRALGTSLAIGGTLFVTTEYILKAIEESANQPQNSQYSNDDKKAYEKRALLDSFVNWSEVQKGWKIFSDAIKGNSGGGGR